MTLCAAALVQLAAGEIAASRWGFPIFGIFFLEDRSLLGCFVAVRQITQDSAKLHQWLSESSNQWGPVLNIGILQVWGVLIAREHQVWLQDIPL